jgi:hypothetical protein
MLARYKLYRGSRADDDPLPVGIRQDTRKHTGHCLRPSEEAVAEYLASGDESAWRIFANSRGWRFRLASHGGGEYLQDQALSDDFDNMPGAVVYERQSDVVVRKNSCVFGPGDLYCSMWSLLALAGLGEEEWTPQYTYWRRP